MSFLKYPHLERYGSSEVADIDFGTVHIFPKLDGTNASVWWHDGRVRAGSRNRELDTINFEQDNAGFAKWVSEQEFITNFLSAHDHLVLYGEWLVPHTIKSYKEDAWRKFYVFDVWDKSRECFWTYDDYAQLLDEYQFNVVPCTKVIKNASYENLKYEAENNTFLVNEGVGEGIVIKNYNWKNKYNNVVWAKMVTSEFKTKHSIIMGAPELTNRTNAEIIADIACTETLVRKEYAKLLNESGEFSKHYIPRLLHTVYHCVVKEELWDCLKKINRGNVNFRELEHHCNDKVKQFVPEVFGK